LTTKSNGYWLIAIFISLLGAICFSTKAIFVKLAYRDSSVDTITLLSLRMLFSLPFFAGAAVFSSSKGSNVRFTFRQWMYVAAIGCLGYYVSSYLDFLGLQFISAGIERLILFTFPTFVVLINSFWFKEKISLKQILALAITYSGLLIAYVSEVKLNFSGSDFYFGSACIFVCAITYAIYIAGSGRLIPSIGSVKFNSYAMAFACVGVLLHFIIWSDHSLFGLPTIVYIYSLFMALVSTVIPSYLVSISLDRIGANNTAIVGSIGPISTIIQAYYFLGERVSPLQWLGTVFILVGILIISWKKNSSESI